jgi:hypothetical protein
MEHWHITRNGITHDSPTYYSRKDAEFAVGVLLQREVIIGTKYAITRDYNTGTCYELKYDDKRGAYIHVKDVA